MNQVLGPDKSERSKRSSALGILQAEFVYILQGNYKGFVQILFSILTRTAAFHLYIAHTELPFKLPT